MRRTDGPSERYGTRRTSASVSQALYRMRSVAFEVNYPPAPPFPPATDPSQLRHAPDDAAEDAQLVEQPPQDAFSSASTTASICCRCYRQFVVTVLPKRVDVQSIEGRLNWRPNSSKLSPMSESRCFRSWRRYRRHWT